MKYWFFVHLPSCLALLKLEHSAAAPCCTVLIAVNLELQAFNPPPALEFSDDTEGGVMERVLLQQPTEAYLSYQKAKEKGQLDALIFTKE